MNAGQGAPFSRVVKVDDLVEDAPVEIAFEAGPQERAAIATLLGAPAVEAFRARLDVLRRPRGRVEASGTVTARLTRLCVVSLEPFETEVEEPVAVRFATEAEAAAEAARAAHEPAPGETLADQPDPPDPIIDGRIDLGAVALEFLTLALDPYPRKPGTHFEAPEAPPSEGDSPFAALERLNRKG